jgi:hypothetical protein
MIYFLEMSIVILIAEGAIVELTVILSLSLASLIHPYIGTGHGAHENNLSTFHL